MSDGWQHGIGNGLAFLIAIFSVFERYGYGTAAVLPIGIICSVIVVGILLYTGWKGGEMVYRHRVAVYDRPESSPSVRSEEPRRVA